MKESREERSGMAAPKEKLSSLPGFPAGRQDGRKGLYTGGGRYKLAL